MWKKRFSSDVLSEAHEYCSKGFVDDFHYINGKVSAVVGNFNVFISFKDDDIDSMYCDCRCGCCRHIAAVLYYLDSYPQKDYSVLVSSCSYDELVEFLNNELPNSPELLNSLAMYKNGDADSEYYQAKFLKCCSSYVKVINFISTDLEKLKATGQIDLILTLMKCIVEYVYELNDGGMYDEYDIILAICGHFLCDLINMGWQDEVLNFLAHYILNSEDETVADYFSYIYSHFRNPEELFEGEADD